MVSTIVLYWPRTWTGFCQARLWPWILSLLAENSNLRDGRILISNPADWLNLYSHPFGLGRKGNLIETSKVIPNDVKMLKFKFIVIYSHVRIPAQTVFIASVINAPSVGWPISVPLVIWLLLQTHPISITRPTAGWEWELTRSPFSLWQNPSSELYPTPNAFENLYTHSHGN